MVIICLVRIFSIQNNLPITSQKFSTNSKLKNPSLCIIRRSRRIVLIWTSPNNSIPLKVKLSLRLLSSSIRFLLNNFIKFKKIKPIKLKISLQGRSKYQTPTHQGTWKWAWIQKATNFWIISRREIINMKKHLQKSSKKKMRVKIWYRKAKIKCNRAKPSNNPEIKQPTIYWAY